MSTDNDAPLLHETTLPSLLKFIAICHKENFGGDCEYGSLVATGLFDDLVELHRDVKKRFYTEVLHEMMKKNSTVETADVHLDIQKNIERIRQQSVEIIRYFGLTINLVNEMPVDFTYVTYSPENIEPQTDRDLLSIYDFRDRLINRVISTFHLKDLVFPTLNTMMNIDEIKLASVCEYMKKRVYEEHQLLNIPHHYLWFNNFHKLQTNEEIYSLCYAIGLVALNVQEAYPVQHPTLFYYTRARIVQRFLSTIVARLTNASFNPNNNDSFNLFAHSKMKYLILNENDLENQGKATSVVSMQLQYIRKLLLYGPLLRNFFIYGRD